MLRYFSTAINIAKNHLNDFYPNPNNLLEVASSRKVRFNNTVEYQSSIPLLGKDLQAVQKFWANQAYFLIALLRENFNFLCECFPELAKFDLSLRADLVTMFEFILNRDEIVDILMEFLQKDNEAFGVKEMDQNNLNSEDKPSLFVRCEDIITFIYEQLRRDENKKILVQDASNQQRPGAAPYKRGTLQECYTRFTDLFQKIPVDFYDVQQKMQAEKQCRFSNVILPAVDVDEHKRRYLKVVLEFVKNTLNDDKSLLNPDYKMTYFKAQSCIYGEMQNVSFEIPFDGGFLKNVRLNPYSDQINTTNDLFNEDGQRVRDDILGSSVSHDNHHRILIVEVAAPDKRKREGEYDRACTLTQHLSQSNQDSFAGEMIRNSMRYTLQKGIENEANIIILSAFGCGAFENDPEVIAQIMSKELIACKDLLKGKEVRFMTLDPKICARFNAVLVNELADHFTLYPYTQQQYLLNQVNINLIQSKIPTTLSDEEVLICGQSSYLTDTVKGASPYIGIFNLSKAKRDMDSLTEGYSAAILIARNENKKILHMPLVGTGKLGFSVEQSILGLITALEKMPLDIESLQVNVYVPELKNYEFAKEYIAKKRVCMMEANDVIIIQPDLYKQGLNKKL